MGIAKRTAGAAFGASLVVAATVGIGAGTATAEPEGHTVHYTLTAGAPYDFTITYLTAQPASKQAFNADSNAYMQRATVTVSPDAPWVFDTNLADPQWAFLQVASTTHGGQGAPNATCEITVDGQVVSHQEHPYSPQCLLSQW